MAALQEQSAEADHTEALNELTLQVIELYYGVLQAEAAVHLLELALEEARLELAELDWQVAAAAASQAEYLQAVSRSLELEGQLIQAQGALERAARAQPRSRVSPRHVPAAAASAGRDFVGSDLVGSVESRGEQA